jgi:hypothetical protein
VRFRRCESAIVEQPVDRARNARDSLGRHAYVAGGCANTSVTEQYLDHAKIRPHFEGVRREAVPQRSRSDRDPEARFRGSVSTGRESLDETVFIIFLVRSRPFCDTRH